MKNLLYPSESVICAESNVGMRVLQECIFLLCIRVCVRGRLKTKIRVL